MKQITYSWGTCSLWDKITKLKDWRTYIISGRLVCKIKLADMSKYSKM